MSQSPARNSTQYWRDLDNAHHMHPFTDGGALVKAGGPRVITKAKGVFLEDSDGNKILDAMAGLWCVNIGYGRKELAEVAYRQMLELPYYNTFFKTTHTPVVELSEKLAKITPEGLNHAFYGSSGSEANDTIVRMVRHYWNVRGKKDKKTFISRNNGYHGSTMAAASLSGMTPMHELSDLPLPGFVHVDQPYWYRDGGDMTPEDFGKKAAKAIEDKILELGADKVAAFIGEPIQGAGGVIMPPKGYWDEVQRICKKHDVLLIADEVICGFGRTGEWTGSALYGIKPDLMPMAKGLTSGYVPLSVVMVHDRIAEVLYASGQEFAHGYTYAGHPVACAVAVENIRILEEEGILERVKNETGPYFQNRIREFADHPLVGEVRGVGLIGAIELIKDKKTHARFDPEGEVGGICRDHCFAAGLVMRATRDSMVISPPLIITKAEIDTFASLVKTALDKTYADVKGRLK